MYRRRQYDELKSRILEPRNKIQVVSGPRQVGKSTMIRQVLKETNVPNMFVSADGVGKENSGWIGDVWETVRARMRMGRLKEFVLAIDEVHKIDNWSEEVKRQWDADAFDDVDIKVILSGSSRLLLKAGLTESLAGRFELIRMPHWSYLEMNEAFGMDVEHYIWFGGYPGSVKFIGNEPRWRRYIKDSIIGPAMEKDILSTAVIYKPELMRRLFELGCTYSGEEISLTKILGQLQDAGNVTTLANYLGILSEAHLLCGLQRYAFDNARKYNSIPKMMVFNTALLSALSGSTYQKTYTEPKSWGRWAESAVGAHLLNAADELDYGLYYWRQRDEEVDFIVERGRQCVAIEVKSGRRSTNTGLSVFADSFHPVHSLVVGTGGVPFEEFLSWDLNNLFD